MRWRLCTKLGQNFFFNFLYCALPIRQRSTKWIFYLKKNNYIQLFYIKRTVKKMDTKNTGKKKDTSVIPRNPVMTPGSASPSSPFSCWVPSRFLLRQGRWPSEVNAIRIHKISKISISRRSALVQSVTHTLKVWSCWRWVGFHGWSVALVV